MRINNISILPNNNSFKAQIPKDKNVAAAFSYAQSLLDTQKPSKIKDVKSFCNSIKNLSEYKPLEDIKIELNRTIYSNLTKNSLAIAFIYNHCRATISNDSTESTLGVRVTDTNNEAISVAQLHFDILKNLGAKIGNNSNLADSTISTPNLSEIKDELESLKLKIFR